jgi:L-ascorbate metabolism protein UlaG (beta-lactamase superfamily)
MRITHYGHAAMLVETADGARLLFDPGTMSSGFEHLSGLTAILVTHGHDDHVSVAAVSALVAANPDAVLLADSETAQQIGARAMQPGDRVELPGAVVEAVGGAHAHVYLDIPATANIGYLVDDGAFFHGGDSYEIPTGPVDVLAVPISGPWVKLGESIGFAVDIAPRIVIPMHEAALSHTGQAHEMLGAFLPRTTTLVVLERGVETEL